MGFYDIEWNQCYQISLKQTLQGQQVLNRWFYQSDSVVSDLRELCEGFSALWLNALEPLQHYTLTYDSIVALALFGERQSYELFVTGRNGSDVASPVPAFLAWAFRLTPDNTRVRKGHKRFSGVTEGMINGNTYASQYGPDVAALNATMLADIELSTDTLSPVLLSPANSLHANNVITPIIASNFAGWTTQSSRKLGRGA